MVYFTVWNDLAARPEPQVWHLDQAGSLVLAAGQAAPLDPDAEDADPDHPGTPFATGVPGRDLSRLMADGRGIVYLAVSRAGGRIRASTTPVGAGALTFAPIAGIAPDAAGGEAVPAERMVKPTCASLAPLPGGCLLVAGDRSPVRVLGLPGDADLMRLVRSHAEAAAGQWDEAARLMAILRKRLPDSKGRFPMHLAGLNKSGMTALDCLVHRGVLAKAPAPGADPNHP